MAPLDGRLGPGNLQTAGDSVGTLAGLVLVGPSETLSLEGRALGLGTDVGVGGSTVSLSKCVATSDKSDAMGKSV